MSIVIKDMKMPESCYYCGLADTSLINCQAFSSYKLLEDDCEERRPEWCHLVELPEKYGRLIDADELMAIFSDRLGRVAERYGIDSSEAGILCGAMKLLESQTAILEAEGEEE